MSQQRSGQLPLSIALFGLGALILFVRFPPADLVGWIARTLQLTLGVPFLVAAALFGAAAWMLRSSKGRRVFRVVSTSLGVLSAVLGILLIATPT